MRRLVLGLLIGLCAAGPGLAARSRAAKAGPPPDPVAFVPPADPERLERQFWQAAYRLERRQAAGSEEPLADVLRADLAALGEAERGAVMRLFLASAHHYDGREDGGLSAELKRRHDERFADRLRDFAILSRRLRAGSPAAGRLFARLRALASPGAGALELSRLLAEADPDNVHVLARLAADLADTGDLRGAVEASERAIALSSGSPRAFTTLASAKYQLKDYAGAHAAASAALALDPGEKVAFAIVNMAQQRLPAEAQALDRAVLDMGDEAGMGRDAVSALAPPAPGMAAAARVLADDARGALRGGDYERAESLASEALEKDARSTSALFRRALARMKRERLDEALSDTARALSLMGESPSPILLTLHAQVLNRLGRSGEAMGFVERALVLNLPTDRSRSQALFQKSWALAGTGERKASLKTLAQAARLNRRYVAYYQEAKAQPEDADLALVFGSDWLAQETPRPAEAKQAEGLLTGRRSLLIGVFSLAGGLLIAVGLVRAAGGKAAVPAPPSAPVPSADGLLAGTYRLGRRIGAGGMGLVFEAVDVNLERKVAIKKMREEIGADPRERERFLREARTVAALKHPNIVEIHAVVGDGSDVYLVFEHVDGHTVTEYLRAYRRIPFDQAVRIVLGAAAALDYAHARGVVHRDLKPSNIMITREGVVKVMDFGVARVASGARMNPGAAALVSTETISGTPQYMPPEQEAGTVRAESDVFALGVCLYEMATGILPFQGAGAAMSVSKSKRGYARASTLVPDLPPGTDSVIDWALDPDPDSRCRTPARLAVALQDLLQPRIGLKPPDQLA